MVRDVGAAIEHIERYGSNHTEAILTNTHVSAQRFVREGDATRMETLDPMPWPTGATAVPVEVEAGDLVCFHGTLPHYSAPNRSPVSRHAYTLHVTDGRAAWSPRNWLRRGPEMPVRGFVR